MSEDEWIQLEYTSLRAEILSRDEAERSSARFYLPAAAAIYTVPYLLAELPRSAQPSIIFLWTFCVSVAGLLMLVMALTLFWAADGTRKIGAYIKECLEPRTRGGLRWEGAVLELTKTRRGWPNETFVVASSGVTANVLAAFAVSAVVLTGPYRWWAAASAAAIGGLAIPTLRRLATVSSERERHGEALRAFCRDRSANSALQPTPTRVT